MRTVQDAIEEAKYGEDGPNLADRLHDELADFLPVRRPERETDQPLPPCYVCGKVWMRGDSGWVYHDSVGVVCRDHHGVKEWYSEMLRSTEDNDDFLIMGYFSPPWRPQDKEQNE